MIRRSTYSIYLFYIWLILVSCSTEKKPKQLGSEGVWLQEGYGKIFEIENDSIKIFDLCKVGCQVYEHLPIEDRGKIESFSNDSLTIRKNIKTYKFVRLPKLPEYCINTNKESDDFVYNFEVLWNTFNENYCFFEKRNVNWDELYSRYKNRITDKTTELEFFQIANEMLDNLNDGHVELEPNESVVKALSALPQQEEKDNKETAVLNRFQLGNKIADKYLLNEKNHNARIFKWGMMKNGIAYLQFNAMIFVAFYDLSKDLSLNEFGKEYGGIMETRTFQRQDEIDGAKLLMDSVINELKGAKALVLDLRFNTGGKDEVVLEFIGKLVNDKATVASKKAKKGSGFTNHQSVILEPRFPNFKKNVYILTSKMTASAAELAVMSTLSNARFTRIGSATEGIFSDGLDKRLPIGWDYTLSNEIYVDYEGINYEGEGIPPNVDLGYPTSSGALLNFINKQLNTTGDAALEYVFKVEK